MAFNFSNQRSTQEGGRVKAFGQGKSSVDRFRSTGGTIPAGVDPQTYAKSRTQTAASRKLFSNAPGYGPMNHERRAADVAAGRVGNSGSYQNRQLAQIQDQIRAGVPTNVGNRGQFPSGGVNSNLDANLQQARGQLAGAYSGSQPGVTVGRTPQEMNEYLSMMRGEARDLGSGANAFMQDQSAFDRMRAESMYRLLLDRFRTQRR